MDPAERAAEILLGMCEAEERFLQGVLDFYQSRTATKMNEAMERLALITVVLLPVTAVASIYGMNVIVNSDTNFPHLAVALTIMGAAAERRHWPPSPGPGVRAGGEARRHGAARRTSAVTVAPELSVRP